jgi:hypothetical protein
MRSEVIHRPWDNSAMNNGITALNFGISAHRYWDISAFYWDISAYLWDISASGQRIYLIYIVFFTINLDLNCF